MYFYRLRIRTAKIRTRRSNTEIAYVKARYSLAKENSGEHKRCNYRNTQVEKVMAAQLGLLVQILVEVEDVLRLLFLICVSRTSTNPPNSRANTKQ